MQYLARGAEIAVLDSQRMRDLVARGFAGRSALQRRISSFTIVPKLHKSGGARRVPQLGPGSEASSWAIECDGPDSNELLVESSGRP